jgi:hypothetical protein
MDTPESGKKLGGANGGGEKVNGAVDDMSGGCMVGCGGSIVVVGFGTDGRWVRNVGKEKRWGTKVRKEGGEGTKEGIKEGRA